MWAHSQRDASGVSGFQIAFFFCGETESIHPTLSLNSHLPTWAASQNLTPRGAPEHLPKETIAQRGKFSVIKRMERLWSWADSLLTSGSLSYV